MKRGRFTITIACAVVASSIGMVSAAPAERASTRANGRIAFQSSSALVSVGSPSSPFPQSWQNGPALAVDPAHPNVLAASAQDTLDAAACGAWAETPKVCPFAGVGFAGTYFSFDGGGSWTQPTYTGLTRRGCLMPSDCDLDLYEPTKGLEPGPIGTIPNLDDAGMFSTTNQGVAFGPVPGPDGTFSWADGSRLYAVTEVQNLPAPIGPGLDGAGATVVSTIDGEPALTPAIVSDQSNWTDPTIATRSRANTLSWAPTVWADNAESSPHFGTTYVCDVIYGEDPYMEERVILGRSTDGGVTWVTKRLSADGLLGEDYCHVRTDSQGTVYVFWEATHRGGKAFWFTRSVDGGKTFEPTHRLATGLGCYPPTSIGPFAVEGGSEFFDGARGVGTATSPSVDIANGAPSGTDATDRIVLVTCKDGDEPERERALVFTSTDGGGSWSRIRDGAEASDRPNLPAIAISPEGEDVFLVYQGFLDPWRRGFSGPRRMQAVIRYAEASDLSTWTTLFRGIVGDARASASPSFGGMWQGDLGIFSSAVATRDGGIAVWTDIRSTERCPAVEAFRRSLIDGNRLPLPVLGTDCPPTFGNSDIYGAALADPSP